jgi:hypothetical protein
MYKDMRLKTVVKFGTLVSVLLFCIAVGYYAFMKLDMTNRHRDVNPFTLIPDDCTVVGIPGRVVKKKGVSTKTELDHGNLPDPMKERIQELEKELAELKALVAKLSKE